MDCCQLVGILAESMDYFLAIGYVSLPSRYIGSTPSPPFYIGIDALHIVPLALGQSRPARDTPISKKNNIKTIHIYACKIYLKLLLLEFFRKHQYLGA
jgi:hypothetical protein